jgi:hypothetical protein
MPITNMLETAVKAKSPILGIQIEGQAPLCIKRELFTASLRGLRIIDAAIQMPLDGNRDHMRLEVWAVGENVKAHRKFAPISIPHFEIQRTMHQWAARQRAKLSQPKLTPRQKVLAKLRKQLTLITIKNPKHPLLYRPEPDYDEYERTAFAAYKHEQNARRWIQSQARLCSAGKLTSAQLYKILRDRGLSVRKWTDLRKHERMHLKDSFHAYLNHMWKYCGLHQKPYTFQIEKHGTMGADHYTPWLERVREYKALAAEIATIEAIPEREKRCRSGINANTAVHRTGITASVHGSIPTHAKRGKQLTA